MKPTAPESEAAGGESLITESSTLSPGDRVVYPNQGVCRVTGVERQTIAGQVLELVRMEREEDGARVMVPRAKVASVGLRRVASREYVEGVFHYLAAQYEDPELDWKIRHRDNADRLVTGGVLGIAEVVKGLHGLSRIRPLPTKEREQYDGARHLLVAEISAALGVPPSLAEDYVDYALMPPAGVTFKLRPPPKPVELPVRLLRRRPAPKQEDDIGLDELGLELGDLGEGGDEEEKGEGTEGGGDEAGSAGAAAEGPEAGGAEEELPAPKGAPARAKPAPKAEKAPPKEKPERKAAPKAAPAKAKPAPRAEKAPPKEKPEKKAAPKAAPSKAKPAPKKPARGSRK